MTAAVLAWAPSPAVALLWLLLAGHVIADFLVQSNAVMREQSQVWRGFVLHGLAVFATQIVVLLPLLSVGAGIALLATSAIHGMLDWTKASLAPDLVGAWVAGAVLIAAFAFNATGGNVLVRIVLLRIPPKTAVPGSGGGLAGAGRLIGMLERTLVLALVLKELLWPLSGCCDPAGR